MDAPTTTRPPGRDRAAPASSSSSRRLSPRSPTPHIEPEHLVADDDHVSIAYTLSGAHEGEFHGVAPTGGKRVEVRGLQTGRFEDGVIVERLGGTDELGIPAQIGAAARA